MLQKLSNNLKNRGFNPIICKNKEEAISNILNIIPLNSSVGMGGSMTLKEVGADIALSTRGNEVLSHSLVSPDKKDILYQLAQKADFYMSSCNAITIGGEIINIDGSANRVSTLAFGPKNIIYVLGKNKIVTTIDEGIDRIRNYVAPKNCIRLNKNTPCAKTGKCNYCNSDDCICNITTIMHHPTSKQDNVYVIIIDEEYGY